MSSAGSGRPASYAEAKQLIEDISKYHKYVHDSDRSQLASSDPALMVGLQEDHLGRDSMIESSVITLAKNLYSSSARFVFELLQNADDNEFSVAVASNTLPYVSFEVFPEKIVLECNEDGFTNENLHAICSIGKSSKIGARGYIGEKTIGFKSVFMSAYKVHIQSGNFSFSFTHRKGDAGMGMISPNWEPPDPNLSNQITRTTLFLHDTGSDLEAQYNHQRIMRQFQEVQGTHLLFLKKIRRIKIKFSHVQGKQHEPVTFELETPVRVGRVALRKFVDDKTSTLSRYHLTKHMATHLSRSESRSYTMAEEKYSTYSQADVIVAFPLDDNSNPITETQQVYAFLPIRNMGFKFLIHSDFVIEANRQDIVTTSSRNRGLIEHIASAFVYGLQELCQHEKLQFTWSRYLPQSSDYPWNDYWKAVIASMKKKITNARLIRPRSGGALKTIEQMRYLPESYLDENAAPLFADVQPELYLSEGYDYSAHTSLKAWGLRDLHMKEGLDRIDSDLKQKLSRFKSPHSTSEWHKKAANFLNLSFRGNRYDEIERIRALRLIPIQREQWVSAKSKATSLIFPTTNGIDVPTSLDLSIIDKKASNHVERRLLFRNLGAEIIPVSKVRQMILNKYPSISTSLNPSSGIDDEVAISLSHINFLYLAHEKGVHKWSSYQSVRLITQEGQFVVPSTEPIYIINDHRYGTKNLLEGLPPLKLNFLSPAYFNSPPKLLENTGHNLPWTDWLCALGVLSQPQLIKDGKLTGIFRHIIKHRKSVVLGLLQHNWATLKTTILESKTLIVEISQIRLGPGEDSPKLSEYFLPISGLKTIACEYLGATHLEKFPFLDLNNTMAPDDLSKWEFLHNVFNVGKEENVEFYVTILTMICNQYGKPGIDVVAKVYRIYEALQRKIEESPDPVTRRRRQEFVKQAISKGNLLMMLNNTASTTSEGCWEVTDPKRCHSNAPFLLQSYYPVKPSLDTSLVARNIDQGFIERFLYATLDIPICSLEDLTDELISLKPPSITNNERLHSQPSKQHLVDVYQHLHKLLSVQSDYEREKIMHTFRDNRLIFVGSSTYGVDDCLWSSAMTIEGKVSLTNEYPSLKEFFVDMLGVQTLTLQMAYDNLRRLGEVNTSSIDEVRDTWLAFNSLLQTVKEKPNQAMLLAGYLFPVRQPDGQVELCSGSSTFALIDRKDYGRLFSGKARLLDYNFEEVHHMRATFEWLGFESRHLSVCTTKVSALVEGHKSRVSNPLLDIKTKSYGLCRFAAHIGASKANPSSKRLYDILSKTETWETDGISTELHLQQNTETVVVRVNKSNIHISDENEGLLRIWVPKEPKQQRLCYAQVLPERLYEWMTDCKASKVSTKKDERSIRIIGQILNAPHGDIKEMLESFGISELEFPGEYNVGTAPTVSPKRSPHAPSRPVTPNSPMITVYTSSSEGGTLDSGSETHVEDFSTPDSSLTLTPSPPGSAKLTRDNTRQPASDKSRQESPSFPTTVQRRLSPTPVGRVSYLEALGAVTCSSVSTSGERTGRFITNARYMPSTPGGSPARTLIFEDVQAASGNDYIALLSQVITLGRQTRLPRKDSFDMRKLYHAISELDETAGSGDRVSFSYTNRYERDEMIDAAGELYVFEVLSNLHPALPGFAEGNWQSTVRKHVTKHRAYSNMNLSTGIDTADMFYVDISGILTSIMVELGYLDCHVWADRRPTYFIKVKTTHGPCETPFFMSKGQYKRMQLQSQLEPSKSPDIYVVFRVYNLGKISMGLAIYVDPEAMRQKNDLIFVAENYAVTPGPDRLPDRNIVPEPGRAPGLFGSKPSWDVFHNISCPENISGGTFNHGSSERSPVRSDASIAERSSTRTTSAASGSSAHVALIGTKASAKSAETVTGLSVEVKPAE